MSGAGPVACVELGDDARAVGAARRFVAERVGGLPQWCRDDVELLVSELVTNAVRHGSPRIWLTLNFDLPLIEVSVFDEGAAVPSETVVHVSAGAVGGRGLLIVDRVASSWGVVESRPDPGKTVWFRIDPRADRKLAPV